MEEELGNLSIIDKKENPFQAQEDESTLKEDYKLCLVGSYLAASDISLRAPSRRGAPIISRWLREVDMNVDQRLDKEKEGISSGQGLSDTRVMKLAFGDKDNLILILDGKK
ncbi:hypothetical protein Gorai_008890, partial [Gossypium raimondii]|nr:hypothetical protein [Gossypium raimondii]